MTVARMLLAAGTLLTGGAIAKAESEQLAVGDTYIVSRDDYSAFRGSHRIYSRMSDGLVQVEYCGRKYWVRYATVAWTELEVEQNYTVRVEYNWGKGWRPICAHPEEQVTLEGLGIYDDPRVIVQNDGSTVKSVNRFAAIRESFRPTTVEDAANTLRGN